MNKRQTISLNESQLTNVVKKIVKETITKVENGGYFFKYTPKKN